MLAHQVPQLVVCLDLSNKVLAWALSNPVITHTALRGNTSCQPAKPIRDGAGMGLPQYPTEVDGGGEGATHTQRERGRGREEERENNSSSLQFKHSLPRNYLILLCTHLLLVTPKEKSSHTRPTRSYSPSSFIP